MVERKSTVQKMHARTGDDCNNVVHNQSSNHDNKPGNKSETRRIVKIKDSVGEYEGEVDEFGKKCGRGVYQYYIGYKYVGNLFTFFFSNPTNTHTHN